MGEEVVDEPGEGGVVDPGAGEGDDLAGYEEAVVGVSEGAQGVWYFPWARFLVFVCLHSNVGLPVMGR